MLKATFAEENKQLCRANIMLFKWYHFWPKDENDKHYLFRALFVSIPITAQYLSIYAFIITSFSSGKYILSDVIEAITFSILSIGTFTALTILAKRQHSINTLLNNISDFNKFGRPSTTDLIEKRYYFIVHIYHAFCVITILIFFIYTFFETETCKAENIIHDLNRICGLTLPVWLPFPVDNQIKFIILLAIQLFTSIYGVGILVGLYTFLCTLVESILPRIDHLNELLDKVVFGDDNEEQISLSYCIRYHGEIIALVDEINYNFGIIYFTNICQTTIIMTLLLLQLLLEPSIKVVLHLFAWIGPLFFITFAGQRLIDQSESITVKIYNIKWYTAGINQQKDILFMLMRSQHLLHIDPLGLGTLSCQTFSSVISNVYSSFNFVRQTV